MEPQVILASASPRRRALLASAGIPCRVHPVAVDELRRAGEDAESYVRRVTGAKAEAASRATAGLETGPAAVYLVADTIVAAEGTILGKPADREAARATLERLSGRRHEVLTAFCVGAIGEPGPAPTVVRTEVWFKALSAAEIEAYLATGEWSDKAGAYGIQGRAAFMVQQVRGSYTNVVGLPLAEVVDALADRGVTVTATAGARTDAGVDSVAQSPQER